MRRLILGAGLALVFAAPALAQTPNTEQGTPPEPSSSAIQQQVTRNLSAAGYTDIQVMPRSFLVRAKDKNGNPMLMIINPNSVTTVRTLGATPDRMAGRANSQNLDSMAGGANSQSSEGMAGGANSQNSAAGGHPVELTAPQKQKIKQAVADQPAEQAPSSFQPSVGEKVPDSVGLKSLPSSASSDLPQSLQGAQFAKLSDNNIIIADPDSRQVVAVINQNESEQ